MDTYEKKYNDALERAKYVLHTAETAGCSMHKDLLTEIFPELAESEDERIRKWLVEYFGSIKETVWIHRNTITCEQILAYLERQKEQPISAEEVLARAGLKPYKDGNQWCILAGDNIQEGICGFGDTIEDALYEFLKEVLDLQKEQKSIVTHGETYHVDTLGTQQVIAGKMPQKPAEWVLPEDFEEAVYKVANFISPFDNQEELRKTSHRFAEQLLSLAKKEFVEKPTGWSEDIIQKAVKEVGLTQHQIDWFKTNVFPPKQEWSEEDEKMIDDLIRYFKDRLVILCEAKDAENSVQYIYYKKVIAWLKSLRPSWKPSEEHLSALLAIFNDPDNIGSQTCQLALTDLYEHLKKL